jgi:hypothetical protein
VKFVGNVTNIVENKNEQVIHFTVTDGSTGAVQCTCFNHTNKYLPTILKRMIHHRENKVNKHIYEIHGMLNYNYEMEKKHFLRVK